MAPTTLSLKQRLAALSANSSAPSSPTFSSSPTSPKRTKTFNFAPPWGKKTAETLQHNGEPSSDGRDMTQEAMAKMIFQAGVDFETRPMVVVNASALPDPREVNYDLLLYRILSYLNLYVESDYTVVFFAAGGRNTPGWNWVWKAYRSLSRKYRKNLKRLFVVHSSFFTKMLFSLAGAIISPKFFRKIAYMNTLSELACYIPLTQIDIPPAVYQENLKHEKKITLPVVTVASTFGVPLEDLMGFDGEKGGIPRVVKDAIQFLRDTGMEEEGLFRRSPNSGLLRAAQDAYDRGNVVSLETFADPHLAAVLLKKYLRDLPEPIFPESMYTVIRKCPAPSSDPTDMSSLSYIRDVLLVELPPCAYILMNHILHLMHEVSLRSATNRMDAHNLALVLAPNLVKSSSPVRDVMMCAIPGGPTLYESKTPTSQVNAPALSESKTTVGMVIKLCIQRYYEIFDEVRDRGEAVPPQRSALAASSSSSTPSSASVSPKRQSIGLHDDDEDIDDAMLVMPIGPSQHQRQNEADVSGSPRPPSAWAGNAGSTSTFKPRHRNTLSNTSSGLARSMFTVGADSNASTGYQYSVSNKARSTISIEKGSGTVTGRKGSISVGRGTNRKSVGAGVEAISITAEGFFSAPSGDAKPVASSTDAS
ncbi:CDC42 rho GTPase-activating protein [Mycena floridula]|nr:CDC42 rho GTPase-activating protein [Mycena floridula]